MSQVANPWVTPPDTSATAIPGAPVPEESVPAVRDVRPHAGVSLPVSGGPPVWIQPSPARWWWLGCHGGAGVSTLQHACGDGADALRGWPHVAGAAAQHVVLVARSTAAGLQAAQTAARQWAAGGAGQPGPVLLGLVVVADAPGRLPPPLRRLQRLVAGGVPRTWEIPFADAWRLGEDPATTRPRAAGDLARDLNSLTESGT